MRCFHPIGHRARHTLDIRRQRGIVLNVIARVLTHHVDNAGARFFGVVQIGKAVAQARPQMQQGRRRFARHAVIAVRCTSDHTLEQSQYATHAFNTIKR